MEKRNKIIAFVVAFVLIVLLGGTIMVNFGLPNLLQADAWTHHPTCEDLLVCVKLPLTLRQFDDNHNIISKINGTMYFSSKTVFAVNNPINYEIDLTTTGIEKIKHIYFILGSNDYDFDTTSQESISKLVQTAEEDERLIHLVHMPNDRFYQKGSWTNPLPTDVVLMGIIVHDNDVADPTQTSGVLITVESEKVKSEAEQNQESRITNKVVLGLTWMGIAIVPMLVGADMILRVIFEGKD